MHTIWFYLFHFKFEFKDLILMKMGKFNSSKILKTPRNRFYLPRTSSVHLTQSGGTFTFNFKTRIPQNAIFKNKWTLQTFKTSFVNSSYMVCDVSIGCISKADQLFVFVHTVVCRLVGIGYFGLKARVIIKISTGFQPKIPFAN